MPRNNHLNQEPVRLGPNPSKQSARARTENFTFNIATSTLVPFEAKAQRTSPTSFRYPSASAQFSFSAEDAMEIFTKLREHI
jgi:hypothetical protein